MNATAGVLIYQDGKVLLVKHLANAKQPTGHYGFPAGRVEQGETEKQAAVRELLEETGLTVNESDLIEFPGNYVESTLQLKHGPEEFSYRVFIVKKYSGELRATDQNSPEWLTLDEVSVVNLVGSVKEILESGLNYINNNREVL